MKKLIFQFLDIIIIFSFNTFLLELPLPITIISSLIIYLGIYSFRVYETQTMKSYTESLIKTTVGTLISFILILILYFFLNKYFNRYFFLSNLLFTILILPILHKIEYNIYEKSMPIKNYLVIGRKEEIGHIMQEISEKTLNKIVFTQYINPDPITLDEIIKQNKQQTKSQIIHGIVITDPELEKHVKPQIQHYKEEGMEIEYLPNMAEKYLNRIPIEVAQKFKEYYEVIFNNIKEHPSKRFLDITISTIALVILSPIILILSILILLEDGKPVVYKQQRVGLNGEKFTMHKFRSMKNKTDQNEAKFATDEQDRILKIGKIMRPIRLDEILQFYDILIGKMSFVGPRPEQIPLVEEYNGLIPFYWARHKLKPGLTGWAQIMYKYSASLEETKMKLSYDLYYVKNRDIFLDLNIIIKTIEAVIWRRGAV
ncbi:exopolysaccharide biosynthesis polyprenyl glycosylphosphotransferase [Petrotoga sp. 9PWA.NaAc.5.4]|uniref:exopolysaccharide biosynthesis polyprenyl glycosylphosphotransferase n=1 Tax=Petrotoga sp. 9PWA.NaAc.5.4 TaxID=1434328 RepID=UPI000CC53107|nr:exopolysaccharide biosynthesis polyprenyl glycosylphosphotransferase [Petrotoga sp. 9PWA.NaAc.5.4]PNR93184.1 polyprenyl glycosylphosphotransferase [Petrotoga sp. 9PWA.NaAc.5.4]